VAQRTFDIGAGIYLNMTTPEHILQTVETILDNAVYQRNANAIGQTLRESGGARKAADTILQTIK
ncbi:MAG: glucosyltransferase, partial [Peptococcaceae bacterium]|nr:glucosyltransferase [Peptococcaceae bacterium]